LIVTIFVAVAEFSVSAVSVRARAALYEAVLVDVATLIDLVSGLADASIVAGFTEINASVPAVNDAWARGASGRRRARGGALALRGAAQVFVGVIAAPEAINAIRIASARRAVAAHASHAGADLHVAIRVGITDMTLIRAGQTDTSIVTVFIRIDSRIAAFRRACGGRGSTGRRGFTRRGRALLLALRGAERIRIVVDTRELIDTIKVASTGSSISEADTVATRSAGDEALAIRVAGLMGVIAVAAPASVVAFFAQVDATVSTLLGANRRGAL